MPGGTRNIKMSSKEKAKVSGQNNIPIDKEKLREEHKSEFEAITDDFEPRRGNQEIQLSHFCTTLRVTEGGQDDTSDELGDWTCFCKSCSDHGQQCP